jgi:SAM-dependent methyltransferase
MGLYSTHLRPRLLNAGCGEKTTGAVRERVCAGLAGDVVEIGYGSGLNQPHLPPEVTGVWTVEPSATAIRLAEQRRAASPIPVVVAGEDGRSLPFPDHRFDAALCTWVLCAIPDAHRVLTELARVLKPGATLHFVEHGLAPEPEIARWQRRGNRINRAVAGCRLDNDVRALMSDSPLTVTDLTNWYQQGTPRPVGYMYEGRATA